jgi:hypothetical protein
MDQGTLVYGRKARHFVKAVVRGALNLLQLDFNSFQGRCLTNTLAIFVSDLDFTVLFRLFWRNSSDMNSFPSRLESRSPS